MLCIQGELIPPESQFLSLAMQQAVRSVDYQHTTVSNLREEFCLWLPVLLWNLKEMLWNSEDAFLM